MKVIIMAQGEATRWLIYDHEKHGLPAPLPPEKHWINMGKFGLPLISRTTLMLLSIAARAMSLKSLN